MLLVLLGGASAEGEPTTKGRGLLGGLEFREPGGKQGLGLDEPPGQTQLGTGLGPLGDPPS